MKKIAIIGHGYVGKAVGEFFEGKFDLFFYDPNYKEDPFIDLKKKTRGGFDQDMVNECELAIVCVPTPMLPGGKVDTSYIESTFEWLKTPLILIKSTVPPGTTKALAEKYKIEDRLVFSPELIGEGGYPLPVYEGMPHPTDMKQHHYFTFGGNRAAVMKVIPYFTKVRGPFCDYRITDSTTAELSKYMENVWIATKVTFCNEMYDIAEKLGVDYIELREHWLADGRVGKSHTLVYPDKRGFDGKCIPKDTNGLVDFMKSKGYTPKLLSAVLEANKDFNEKNSGNGK